MSQCEIEHVQCRVGQHGDLPKRVICLGRDSSGGSDRLHISKAGENARYAALSYCWGGPQRLVASTKNIEELRQKVPYEKLPKTLQDAFAVARRLGFHYLWIDSLCILQDSDDDKIHQIAAMGKIYKNATIVIAAASATGVNDGFLEDREAEEQGDAPMVALPLLLEDGSFGQLFVAHTVYRWSDQNPLSKRAWSFQESLLSARLLFYGQQELTWTCKTHNNMPLEPSHVTYNPFLD